MTELHVRPLSLVTVFFRFSNNACIPFANPFNQLYIAKKEEMRFDIKR